MTATKKSLAAAAAKPRTRTVLASPFNLLWPAVGKEQQAVLVDLLQRHIAPVAERHAALEAAERKRRQTIHREVWAAVDQDAVRDKLLRKRLAEQVRERVAAGPKAGAEMDASPFSQAGLVLGVNACTRALERGQLQMLVVARDIQPVLVIQHLLPLCYRADTLLLPLSDGSAVLSTLCHSKRVAALGILRSATQYAEIVETAQQVLPILSFPWLPKLNAAANASVAAAAPVLLPVQLRELDSTQCAPSTKRQLPAAAPAQPTASAKAAAPPGVKRARDGSEAGTNKKRARPEADS